MGYSANGNINVTHPLVTPDNNKKYALDSISSVGGTWQQTSQSTTVSTALTSDLNLNGTFNNEDSKYRATLKLYNETTQTNAPTYSEYINNRGVEVGTNINSPLGAWTASSNATLRVQNIINRKQSPLTTAKNGIGYTIGASISRNLRDNTEIKGSFNATENMGQGRGQEVEIATTFPVNDIKLSFGVSAGHSDRYYIKPLFGVETNCFHISTGLDCYGGYAGKFGFKTIF